MKKILLTLVLIVASAMIFSSCSNCSGKKVKEGLPSNIKQLYLETNAKEKMDSLFSMFKSMGATNLYKGFQNGTIKLSDKQQKVKPDYLFPLDKSKSLLRKTQKLSAFVVYTFDRNVAKMYDMPLEAYDKVLGKLVVDTNSPAILDFYNKNDYDLFITDFYNEMFKSNNLNYFWEVATSALIESMYLTSKNIDLYTLNLKDEDVIKAVERVYLLKEAINQLLAYHPEMNDLNKILIPLYGFDATNVKEFKEQLLNLSVSISEARKYILN